MITRTASPYGMVTYYLAHLRMLLAGLAALLIGSEPYAQPINISLHSTAVPDSFEVRLTSAVTYNGVINGVFTVRWESAAGGAMVNSDLRAAWGGYSFANYTGVAEVVGHRYFTIVFLGNRPLSQNGVAIGPQGLSLGGLRIRQLSGCRHVEIAGNTYIGLNNLAYYVSNNGIDHTGTITSAPLSTGDCPPCAPPLITDIGASGVAGCGMGVGLWSTVTGTAPDIAWYDMDGDPVGWLTETQITHGSPGTYTLVASNGCGADTAQAVAILDPEFCEPPVINNAWYQAQGGGFDLHITVVASCPGLSWILPGGGHLPVNTSGVAHVSGLQEGIYQAVAINACGADTLELLVNDPQGCTGPTIITASITAAGTCHTGPVQFNATVSGQPGTVASAWHTPGGSILTNSPQLNMPFAAAGNYMFTAWNDCDADTVYVFHGPADTTGLAACMAPEIISISVASAACLNDTILLVPTFTNQGPCAQAVWSNVTVLSSTGDTTIAVASSTSPIRFTVTNACGQTTMQVPIQVWYAYSTGRKLCGPTTPLSLDTIMHTSLPYQGGEWFLNNQPHNPYYDPTIDTNGFYFYRMEVMAGLVCPVFRLQITEYPGAYAGEDTTVVVCTTDPPFLLFDMLGGNPMPGGYWSYNSTSPNLSFNPSVDPPGDYLYTKKVGMLISECIDHALLTIAVDTAFAWYIDTDGDGLGDPLDSLLGCEPLAGYVANGDDACPQLFGTVGDPCNDGDPATNDDVITAACICAGELGIGMPELEHGPLRLWPNPAHGGAFFLQVPMATGRLSITLHDATGRVVWQDALPASPNPLEVKLPEGTAAGSYVVSVLAVNGRWVQRLVVD